MATRLRGYIREKGTGRGYLTPEGERISYRQYRNILEREHLVERLDIATLANVRRKRQRFGEIVDVMYRAKKRPLENRLETAKARGRERAAAALSKRLRVLKSEVIKSPERKDAQKVLSLAAHPMRHGSPNPDYNPEAAKAALIMLGRREGIPDWVPVGGSDKFRAGMLRAPSRRFNATGRN